LGDDRLPERNAVVGTVRVRGGRQGGRVPRARLFAAAAVFGLVIGFAIVPRPERGLAFPSSPVAVSSPTAPPPTATLVPTSTAPAPAALPSPIATPVAGPVLGRWDLVLPLNDEWLRLEVVDHFGAVLDARPAAGPPDGTVPRPEAVDDTFALDIRPVPGSPNDLYVGWSVLGCEYHARLTVGPAAGALALSLAPSPGCDLVGIPQAVILTFDGPADATHIAGRLVAEPLFAMQDFQPGTIAFSDAAGGWVGGTTTTGDAIVLRTLDGGGTWRVSGLGEGSAIELAAIDVTRALGSRRCGDPVFNCHGGVLSWDEHFGGWATVDLDRAISMDFAHGFGVRVSVPEDGDGLVVQSNDQAGEHPWSDMGNPCDAGMLPADADRLDQDRFVFLCVGKPVGTRQAKRLYFSDVGGDDRGRLIASSGQGEIPVDGTAAALDLAADGRGWMWGDGMPLLRTDDGGTNWEPDPVIDGHARVVLDATYLGDGSGWLLVHDVDGQQTILARSADGRRWEDMATWPAGPASLTPDP
jgi:hypothetical protein